MNLVLGWRVRVLGQDGPYRSAKHDAKNDLACLCAAATREEMLLQLRKLKDSGLEQLSQQLLQITRSERLVMKLGSEGFIAYDRGTNGQLRNQPFPALSVNPVDVAGAGDSLLALFATGLASGQAMMPTAALACCMASLAVETMGNTPISASALRNGLDEVLLT